MARFRLLLITLAVWLTLLFNLERPDIVGIGNIDLASMVYVIAAAATVIILMLPDLGHERLLLVFLPFFIVYVGIKVYISHDHAHNAAFVYLTITEIATLFVTVYVARIVSLAVANFEDAVESTALGTDTSRILSTTQGEEEINNELFRARRFDRPVSLVYLRVTLLPGMAGSLSEQFNLETAFRRRYIQARIAQVVEAAVYRSDIVAWHNDNLVVCLPETNREQAEEFASQLYALIQIRLNLSVKMGVAAFPQDALIFPDLVDAALLHPMKFETELVEVTHDQDPPSGSNGHGGDGRDDPLTRLKRTTQQLIPVEQVKTAWYSKIASLSNPPNLLPANGVVLVQTSVAPKVTDPEFWVNRFPYQSASARMFYRQIKRIFDLVVVGITLPFVLPVLGLVALLILIESGRPIFFVQMRTGLGGRRFKMYKFRSMVSNAEEMLRELAAQGLAKLDADGKLAEPLKLERDPRVTRVGRILRKTSLDELPQLLNVLKGDMSLVGPRPTSWNVDSYTLMQTERLSVRPGITGLWQVCSRGTTDFNTWLEWDVRYIEKMSFTLISKFCCAHLSRLCLAPALIN